MRGFSNTVQIRSAHTRSVPLKSTVASIRRAMVGSIIEFFVTPYLFKITRNPSMEMSFFDSVLPWFRAVGVSKRHTQAATLVLRLMGRCTGLKRPCTGLC